MSETPRLSVVVPVHNEEDNVAPLVGEILAALRGAIDFEIVYVDDTSKDATLARLRELQASVPELRVVRHVANAGQSTAVRNGVKAARAPWIATLDGDGQNDPADIPKLLAERDRAAPDTKLFAGWRVNYDAVLVGLAALITAPPAPWVSDRPLPPMPRMIRRRER